MKAHSRSFVEASAAETRFNSRLKLTGVVSFLSPSLTTVPPVAVRAPAEFDVTVVTGNTLANSRIEATIEIASVNTNQKDRDNHLRASDFFLVEEFPTATFTSTSISADGDDFTVVGDFTLRGVTKSIELAGELVERGLTASEGSLYPLLARMLASRLVDTRWETVDGGRPRKYYAVTTAGLEGLQRFTEVWRSISPEVNKLVKEQKR